MTPAPDTRDPAGAWHKAQRDLTSLLGLAVLATFLAVAIWAFTGAGGFWPAWVAGGFTLALGAACARAAAARPRRAGRPSPGGPGA